MNGCEKYNTSWQAMTCVRHMRHIGNRRRGTLVLSASAASPSAENLRHQNNSNSSPQDVTPQELDRQNVSVFPRNETIDAVGWLQSWFLSIFLNDFSMILVSTCSNMFQHCRRWVNFQDPKMWNSQNRPSDLKQRNYQKMSTMHVLYFEPSYALRPETMSNYHVHS